MYRFNSLVNAYSYIYYNMQNLHRQVQAVDHPHTVATVRQLQLWTRYWAVVSDRRVLTRTKWTKVKDEIRLLIREMNSLLAIRSR